jgi:hypothetical protein
VTATTIPDKKVTEGGVPGYMGGGSATLLMLRLLVRPCSEATTLLQKLGRRWSSRYA